jgi:hypothetical protein
MKLGPLPEGDGLLTWALKSYETVCFRLHPIE